MENDGEDDACHIVSNYDNDEQDDELENDYKGCHWSSPKSSNEINRWRMRTEIHLCMRNVPWIVGPCDELMYMSDRE